MYFRSHQKLMIRFFLVHRIKGIQIIILSISLGVIIFFPNIVLGQLTEQQLQVDTLYTQTFTILGGIAVAGATTFFAWQHERRTPPPAEQERIIQDIIKEWYSRNYLDAYHRIWKKIEESNEDENVIDEYWRKLSSKKFPEEYLPNGDSELHEQIEYFRNKLHLGKKEETEKIENRIKAIRNSADVEYYTRVRLILPYIADIAVTAAIDCKAKSTDFTDRDCETLVESSLKNLKKLMIFYRIRENKQVCKILMQAKLNEKILNLGSTSANGTLSGGEI